MIELEHTRRRFLTRCVLLGAAVSLPSAALAHRVMPRVWCVPVSDDGRVLSPIQVATVVHSDAQWRALLGSAVFSVARRAGTEPPYSGALLEEHRAGVFRCVCCDTALFLSQTKFDSGTGWPSFWQPVATQNVLERPDLSSGMNRVEVLCSR
jgi:peptide-methionine (R)-S-oxide reductase